MILDFLYNLRREKIPVSTGEYLAFLKALRHQTEGKGYLNLEQLYRIGRMCLVKDLKNFDGYDIAFAKTFQNPGLGLLMEKEILWKWLEEVLDQIPSPEAQSKAPKIELEDLWKELWKRLAEQKEKHDGGSYWVGTSGTSPFGNNGVNPQGIRMGNEGVEGGKTATYTWNDRNFKSYRSDQILDTRSIQVALKELRLFKKEGKMEMDLDKTIDATCRNAGEIEIIQTRSEKNQIRLLLVMDTGGSMTPFANRVNQLFSASKSLTHFKELHTFYFHNIFHSYWFSTEEKEGRVSLERLEKKFRKHTKVIYVGDAFMAPYELFSPPYNPYRINFGEERDKPLAGIEALQKMKQVFPDSVWLNPEPERNWDAPTIEAIANVVPMYFLSVEGIRQAVKSLLV